MSNLQETWIVVPAYNERETLGAVVENLIGDGWSVVVVDDGSIVPVRDCLKNSGAHLCVHLVNLGQGAALQTGIQYALSKGARYIITFDADGQHDPKEIPRLIAPLQSKEFDIALGSRFTTNGRAVNISPAKWVLLKLAVAFTRCTTRLAVTDTHNGFRAMTADAANRIEITQNRMSHATQILQQVKELGLRFTEVPVTISYTDYSKRKGQRIMNAFNILWESFVDRMV